MDLLKESALTFQRLVGSDYFITAQRGQAVIHLTIYFEQGQFVHLVGLSKLIDLPNLSGRSKQSLFHSILNDEITYESIRKSAFFDLISERIHCFPQIESLLDSKVVLKFNRHKAHSGINASMLLYRRQGDTYLHLFLAPDRSKTDVFVPCSFFPRDDGKYIEHQEIYKIIDIQKIGHSFVGGHAANNLQEVKMIAGASPKKCISRER